MKADFETLTAIISFLTSAAGVGGLISLIIDDDFQNLLKTLGGLIRAADSDYDYIKQLTRKLGGRLFTGILILHLVNLGVYALILLIVIVGLDRLPPVLLAGTTAAPFTILERLLYYIWLVISLLVYFFRCIAPTLDAWALYHRARKWLKAHQDV